MENKIFSKIARPISEFLILAILKEKTESHTYEIQQNLLAKFSTHDSQTIDMITKMASIIEKVLTSTNNIPMPDNELSKLLKSIPNENFKSLLSLVIEQQRLNPTLQPMLQQLVSELKVVEDLYVFPEKIWDSAGAIYQVMKELERQGLIVVSTSTIVNGRTRKLYKITEKGELEALKMAMTFSSVDSSIYPMFSLFSDSMNQFYKQHFNNLSNIMKKLSMDNREIHSHIEMIHTKPELNNSLKINPFIHSQYLLIIQLLGLSNTKEDEIIHLFSLEDPDQNQEITEKLLFFRERLDNLINLLHETR